MKKFLCGVLAIILVGTLAFVGCAQPASAPSPTQTPTAKPAPAPTTSQPQVDIQIYSAQFGGVNYLAGMAIAELLNKNHPWIRATNIETAGASENIKRMDKDDPATTARAIRTTTGTVFWTATNGRPPFEKKYD